MSVVFEPVSDFNKPVPVDEKVWSGNYVQKVPWNILPERFKQLGDFDYKVWEMGLQTFHHWEQIVHQLKLHEIERYNHQVTWADDGPNVLLIAYGNRHVGQELQISNRNVSVFCQMLGIPESGSSHPLALLKAIEKVNSGRVSEFGINQAESGGDGSARFIDMGLSEDQILSYCMRLEAICDYCIHHECNVHWG